MITGLVEDWFCINNKLYGQLHTKESPAQGYEIIEDIITPRELLKIGAIVQSKHTCYVLGKPVK